MKYLLISFIFISCTQKVLYFERESKNRMKQISLYGKKDGEYRGLALSYKLDDKTTYHFFIYKIACDSFVLHRAIKKSKKVKDNYKMYIVSGNGAIKADFSREEIQLISELKNKIDSLGWCQSNILSKPDSLFISLIKKKKTSQ